MRADRVAAVVLVALALLFIPYVAFYANEFQPADWTQIMLLFALVVVTLFYAVSAHRQAEASVKAVEEMREQRQGDLMPILLPEADPFTTSVVPPSARVESLNVWVQNLGPGPGLKITIALITTSAEALESKWNEQAFRDSIWSKESTQNVAALAAGACSPPWEIIIRREGIEDLMKHKNLSVVVECEDVYKRRLRSWREFCVRRTTGGSLEVPKGKVMCARIVDVERRWFSYD